MGTAYDPGEPMANIVHKLAYKSRVEEAVDLFEQGLELAEIAERMDIQENTVVVHLRKGGKVPRWENPTKVRNEDILAARSQGKTLREIGRLYGIGHERVRQIIQKQARLDAEKRSGCKYGLDGLSVRSKNSILNSLPREIYREVREGRKKLTPNDVGQYKPAPDTPNFGKKSQQEVNAWLRSKGIES